MSWDEIVNSGERTYRPPRRKNAEAPADQAEVDADEWKSIQAAGAHGDPTSSASSFATNKYWESGDPLVERVLNRFDD